MLLAVAIIWILGWGRTEAPFAPVQAAPAQQGPPASVTYSPYWTTQNGFDTILLINNPDVEFYPLTLKAYSRSGRLLEEAPLRLAPVESTHIRLNDLIGET